MDFIQINDAMLENDSRLVDFLLLAALDSDPRFFDLIYEHVRDAEEIVRQLILDSRSDLHGGLLAIDPSNRAFAGLIVSKSLREVAPLQLHSLREYIKAALEPGNFRLAIKAFAAKKMAAPMQDIHYLARLYVAKNYRGTGLSKQLLTSMFAMGEKLKATTFGLHVDASNLHAISLYQRTGFELQSVVTPSTVNYLYMEKSASNTK